MKHRVLYNNFIYGYSGRVFLKNVHEKSCVCDFKQFEII
jgi:hypothetical protein